MVDSQMSSLGMYFVKVITDYFTPRVKDALLFCVADQSTRWQKEPKCQHLPQTVQNVTRRHCASPAGGR